MMPIKSTYKTFEPSSLNISALLPALVSVIAAGGIIIALAGSPGNFQPVFAVSAGGLVAAIVLALGSRLFRNPAMIVRLSLLFILAGSVSGTLLVAEQAEIDPLLLLGNVQALGAAEVILRFVLGLAVISVLAISCSSPGWSHALAVFSISGPGLILLFSLRSGLDTGLDEGEAEKLQWYLFLGEIIFFGVSAYFIISWLLLERYHARFGQCAISNALKLDSPLSTAKALRLIDGWIDPFRLVEKAVGQQEEARSNQDRLAEAYAVLTQRTQVLNLRTRSWLSLKAGERPETLILLAEDELIRKQTQVAANRISELALAILGDPAQRWIADTALNIFGKRSLLIPVLADALKMVKLAVDATSLLELEGKKEFDAKLCEFFGNRADTLPEAIRAKLDEGAQPWHKAQLILAEDDFRCTRFDKGLIRLTRILASDERASPWIPSVAVDIWAQYSREANSAVQLTLWEIFQSGNVNGVPAYQTLAILILEYGLQSELVERLDGAKTATGGGEPAAAFLRVCDELHRGNLRAALTNFITAVSGMPHGLQRHKFLPLLAELAKREANSHAIFFQENSRPQLLEILEAPPTWIYGGRIGCWTFLNDVGNLSTFATTGHGPAQICTRVSAALNALAHERNCSSDLIFAGASFFDLAPRPSPGLHDGPAFDANELKERAHQLATALGIKDILSDPNTSFESIAAKVARPSIERTLNSLNQIETEMGLLEHHNVSENCRESVLEGLASGSPVVAAECFPVLLPYRVNGKPLRIRLPLNCFGVEEYEEVVEEYRRSTLAEMRQEWMRRLQFHEKWCNVFARTYLELNSKSKDILEKSYKYIQYEIDNINLTSNKLDHPDQMLESNYLRELPKWIQEQLGYWAWAGHSLEELHKEESEFKPHWEQNLLIDSFLRNYPISADNPRLNTALEKWHRNWRPLVLMMLDGSLRLQGMALSDIAQENTVFRVVEQDETSLVLEPSHIWDNCKDPMPKEQAGKRVFEPHFGNRRRVTAPALEIQKQALKVLNKSLIEPIQPAGLQQCLKLDSGAVLDELVATACEGLNRPDDMADEMARVLALAQQKLEPSPVPDRFQGRDRVYYDLAEGDAALELALAMRGHRHLRDEAQLRELIDFLSTCEIQRPFRALDQLCNNLAYGLKQFLSKDDPVTLKLFADRQINDACTIMLDKAEACYWHAAKIDGEFGSGCLSLARLKWQRGLFREALSELFGPVPKADLDACQLPLSVGVRIAGGRLAIKTDGKVGTWQGPEGLSFKVVREDNAGLALEVLGAGFCRACQFSGLKPKDIDILEAFFGKFEPASCHSFGKGSFSEWLQLLKIPNLGMRGALAAALSGDIERSVLVACLYLTPPDVLMKPPGKCRGRSWDFLEEEIVTSLEWGPR